MTTYTAEPMFAYSPEQILQMHAEVATSRDPATVSAFILGRQAGREDEAENIRGRLAGLSYTRHDGYLEVWRDNPKRPGQPVSLNQQEMAEVLATLIPEAED